MNTQTNLKIPPAVVVLLLTVVTWFVRDAVRVEGRPVVALLLLLTACLFVGLGGYAFRRAATTVDPLQPHKATALVVTGIYRFTRNPMYVGFALLLAAWAIYLGSVIGLALLPLFILYMNRFQIAREEAALLERFGESYRSYCRQVRRWV